MWFSMLVRGLLPLKVKHCFVKQDASIQGNNITGTQGYEDPIMGTVAGRLDASLKHSTIYVVLYVLKTVYCIILYTSKIIL